MVYFRVVGRDFSIVGDCGLEYGFGLERVSLRILGIISGYFLGL